MSESDRDTHAQFDAYASHYRQMLNEAPDWVDSEQHPERYASEAPWLPADRGAKILDFGCGWGGQLRSLWCAGYRNVEGVDVSKQQVQIAQHAAGARVGIHHADGRTFLRDRAASYDLIILNDVLEHIPRLEIPEVLRLVLGSLVAGGRIVVRTPNMASLAASYIRYIDATHVAAFTEYSLRQTLMEAGFGDVEFVPERPPRVDLRRWRPWAPWRGFALTVRARLLLNRAIHALVYLARGQVPRPHFIEYNLEAYASKPK